MAPLPVTERQLEPQSDSNTLSEILDDYAGAALRCYGIGLAGAFGARTLIKRPYNFFDLLHWIGWVGVIGLLGLSFYLSLWTISRTAGEIWVWRGHGVFRTLVALLLIGLLFVVTTAVGFYANDLIRQAVQPEIAEALPM